MKILPVGAELLHADGRTDVTKLTVAFRNFVNTCNKERESGGSVKKCGKARVTLNILRACFITSNAQSSYRKDIVLNIKYKGTVLNIKYKGTVLNIKHGHYTEHKI